MTTAHETTPDIQAMIATLNERERAIFDAGMMAGAAQVHQEFAAKSTHDAQAWYRASALALAGLPSVASLGERLMRRVLAK